MPALQSLRFVFVMMIVMSHATLPGLQPFDAGGDCGVAFFFVLSGFVLAHRYGADIARGNYSHRQFLWRRFVRLYPLHLLCLAAWLIKAHAPIDSRVVANALLVQSWIPQSSYYFSCNAPSWFLSTLLFSYLVFPIAWRHATGRILALILALYIVVCAVTPATQITAVLYVNPLVRFVDFFLGVGLHRLYEERGEFLNSKVRGCGGTGVRDMTGALDAILAPTHPRTLAPTKGERRRERGSWAEWLIVAVLASAFFAYPLVGAKLRNAPLFWPVLLPLIWIFAKGTGPVSSLLSHPLLQLLGRLALPIFLTHELIMTPLLNGLPLSPVAAIPLSILTVVIVSWALDKWMLSPLKRVGK